MTNFELTEKIKQILIKKAEGYDYTEETYEYQKTSGGEKQLSFDDILDTDTKQTQTVKATKNRKTKSYKSDDDLTLLKKKVTTHHIPPDMLAVKILLENFGTNNDDDNSLQKLSDQELLALRDNILESLKNIEEEEDNES